MSKNQRSMKRQIGNEGRLCGKDERRGGEARRSGVAKSDDLMLCARIQLEFKEVGTETRFERGSNFEGTNVRGKRVPNKRKGDM